MPRCEVSGGRGGRSFSFFLSAAIAFVTDAPFFVNSPSPHPPGTRTTDVERVLFAFRGIDFHNKVGYDAAGGASSSQFASRSDAATPFSSRSKGEDRDRNSSDSQDDDDSDDEDENEDPTMVGGGRRSGIRRGGGVKKKKAGEEDSDSDFDL